MVDYLYTYKQFSIKKAKDETRNHLHKNSIAKI
jgi:hypothetical protein